MSSLMEEQCPDDPEMGGWLLSPLHHATETSLIALGALLLLVGCLRRVRRELTQHRRDRERDRDGATATHANTVTITATVTHCSGSISSSLSSSSPSSSFAAAGPQPLSLGARVCDALLLLSLSLSLALVAWHKWHGDKLPFLLQPCHVCHAFLIALMLCRRGSALGSLLFSVYLHLLWAPFLGLVAADLSCYRQVFELFNWAFQHCMLLLVPALFVREGRFELYGGRSLFGLSFALILAYHFLVLAPVSLATGRNLNYIVCPPANVGPLVAMGKFYRAPTMLLCALLAWLVRYGCVEALVRCSGHRVHHLSAASLAQVEAEADADADADKDAYKKKNDSKSETTLAVQSQSQSKGQSTLKRRK